MIFLPEDRASWDREETTSVLAHELAHVRRGDYAGWVVARLAAGLHGYQPLLAWLVGRLRADQELAADALAARHAGGTTTYTRALCRLALRHDKGFNPGLARTFLPASLPLTRRVQMLLNRNRSQDAGLPSLWRTMGGLSLAMACLVLAGVRNPIGAEPPPSGLPVQVHETQTGSLIKNEVIRKERQKYQGFWQAVSVEADGKKASAEDAKKVLIINEEDGRWTIQVEGQVFARGISTMDPSKNPKEMDLTATEGSIKGKTYLGIYEIDKDFRKVCYSEPGKDRPTAFSSKEGSGNILAVFHRQKPTDDTQKLQGTWQIIDLEANGGKKPAEEIQGWKIIFQGDEVWIIKPEGADPKLKFKLDPEKKPKTIDLVVQEGKDKGKVARGIYSLEKGQVRLCINIFGNPDFRPQEFKTQDRDGVGYCTLEPLKTK